MTQNAIIVVDLQYGDAGKGSIVDYLTRETNAHTVIRFNGGSQAAHNVVAPDGRHHTFAQFGSGSFVPDVKTYLSRYMLVDPLAMKSEARGLDAVGVHDIFSRTSIDHNALIISPYQQAANKIRELARGNARHGSCGMGIGETMADSLAYGEDMLFAGDLANPDIVRRKLNFIRNLKQESLRDLLSQLPDTHEAQSLIALLRDDNLIDTCTDLYQDFADEVSIVDERYLEALLQQPGTIIFEGAQGVLLDEWYGFHPYTTWSTTTATNPINLLNEHNYQGDITRLGLVRAYMTRHGAGPFVTEDTHLTTTILDQHNGTNPWQQTFRVGYFDAVAIRYALKVTDGIDALVISHLDRMEAVETWQVCNRYSYNQTPDSYPFFGYQNGFISNIRLSEKHDLIYQGELTAQLHQCQPIYETVATHGDIEGYIDAISDLLGVTIGITSNGMTTDDKQLHGELLARKTSIL